MRSPGSGEIVPEPWYIVGVLVTVFLITLALRAVPFAILKPLRKSKVVQQLATWMPVGVLAIIALATFLTSAHAGRAAEAVTAIIVTAAVHLASGRRTLLSVGIGTATYVLLVNLF
jgi:branched-subunit amino acid transport protein AzlD